MKKKKTKLIKNENFQLNNKYFLICNTEFELPFLYRDLLYNSCSYFEFQVPDSIPGKIFR